jgi:hypothetical protein
MVELPNFTDFILQNCHSGQRLHQLPPRRGTRQIQLHALHSTRTTTWIDVINFRAEATLAADERGRSYSYGQRGRYLNRHPKDGSQPHLPSPSPLRHYLYTLCPTR